LVSDSNGLAASVFWVAHTPASLIRKVPDLYSDNIGLGAAVWHGRPLYAGSIVETKRQPSLEPASRANLGLCEPAACGTGLDCRSC
jgi:hypothetical protein